VNCSSIFVGAEETRPDAGTDRLRCRRESGSESAATAGTDPTAAKWSSAAITEAWFRSPTVGRGARDGNPDRGRSHPVGQYELLGALSACWISPGAAAPASASRHRHRQKSSCWRRAVRHCSARAMRSGSLRPLDPQSLERLRARPGEQLPLPVIVNRVRSSVLRPPGALPIVVVAERDRAKAYQAWLKSLQLFIALVAPSRCSSAPSPIGWTVPTSRTQTVWSALRTASRAAIWRLAARRRWGEIGHLTRCVQQDASDCAAGHDE